MSLRRPRAEASATAPELLIYGDIGWYDWDTDTAITAAGIVRILNRLGDIPELTVRINSPGGDAFEGVGIYNALVRHPARILIEVDALAASAASIIAMAGDEIRMSRGSMLMIHEAWGLTIGPAEDHEANATMLRKLNGEMAAIYSERTGQTRDAVLELLAAETWMTPDEAKEQGFADVINAGRGPATTDDAVKSKAAASMVGKYKHAPAELKRAAARIGTSARPGQEAPAHPPRRAAAHAQPQAPKTQTTLRPTPMGQLGRAALTGRGR